MLKAIFRGKADGNLRFDPKNDSNKQPGPHHYFALSLTRAEATHRRIIDVGCWTGGYVSLLVHVKPSILVGVDINSDALKEAHRQNPEVSFVLSSTLHLPFANETFDVATFWTVIEHLPRNEELRALSEMNRTLGADGKLFMSTESNHLLSRILDPAYFFAGHRHYATSKLLGYLSHSHFEVERYFIREGLFRCLSFILLYVYKHVLHIPLRRNFFDDFSRREYGRQGFKTIFLIANKTRPSNDKNRT